MFKKTAIIVCLFFAIALCSIDSYISDEDKTRIEDFMVETQPSNVKEVYESLDTLSLLKSKQLKKVKKDYCKQLNFDSDSLQDIFYSVEVDRLAKCGSSFKKSDIAKKILDSDKDDLFSLVYGLLVVDRLKLDVVIDDIVDSLMDLMDDSFASFRSSDIGQSSSYYAGLALSALSTQYDALLDDVRSQLYDVCLTLFDNAESNDEETLIYFVDENKSVGNVVSTSAILSGVLDFLSASKNFKEITPEKLDSVAAYLVSKKYILSHPETHAVISGLVSFNNAPFPKSVVLTLETESLSINDKNQPIQVRVTNLFGENVASSVYLTKASSQVDKDVRVRNQELTLKKGLYELNFLATRPKPGAYDLEFSVNVNSKEYRSLNSIKRVLSISADIEVNELVFAVSSSRSITSSSRQTLKYGNQFKSVKVAPGNFLHMQFSVYAKGTQRPTKVQQAVLQFTHKETGHVIYFVPVYKNQGYALSINPDSTDEFNNLSGEYELVLIIGDLHITNSFTWDMGVVTLQFSGKPQEDKTANPYEPKPVIEHMFRQPEKQASAAVSSLFSVLVFAPLAVLVLGALWFGNFRNIPGGINFIYAIIFLACIAATLYLFVEYWFGMKLFSALYYLGLIALPAVFSGTRVMKYQANQRS